MLNWHCQSIGGNIYKNNILPMLYSQTAYSTSVSQWELLLVFLLSIECTKYSCFLPRLFIQMCTYVDTIKTKRSPVSSNDRKTQKLKEVLIGLFGHPHISLLMLTYRNWSAASIQSTYSMIRDVTEPAKILIHRMRISCAKYVGYKCGVELPAIIATAIQLSYLQEA